MILVSDHALWEQKKSDKNANEYCYWNTAIFIYLCVRAEFPVFSEGAITKQRQTNVYYYRINMLKLFFYVFPAGRC